MPTNVITPSPHIRTSNSVGRIMLLVIVALLPATALGVYYFGLPALLLVLISVSSAILFEAAYKMLARKPITTSDGSAAITGLLLALTLPPGVPLWMPAVGSFFAVVVVKQIFGGLGHNFLNPALAGRAVLAVSFALPMSASFFRPLSGWASPDSITSPTPLALANDAVFSPTSNDYINALIGNISGSVGEVSAIALLAGGVFLLVVKVISWHIPVSFIATVFVLSAFLHPAGFSPGHAAYQLLLGGLFLGAFFMATDYPTSPMGPAGKLVFGTGCGIITAMFRLYGGFPEGVAYAILLMNLTVPLIDRFIRPRVFGT